MLTGLNHTISELDRQLTIARGRKQNFATKVRIATLEQLKRWAVKEAEKEMEDMAEAMAPEHDTEGMILDAYGSEDTAIPEKDTPLPGDSDCGHVECSAVCTDN